MTGVMEIGVCLSGGAEGSDLFWGEVALGLGHHLIHYTFPEHRCRHPNVMKISEKVLLDSDVFLHKANETLKRKFPSNNDFVNNLLRRNYHQIKSTERVYAIAPFKAGKVSGGTAWATQMYIDLTTPENRELYVFDTNTQQWYEYKSEWKPIKTPPIPYGIWTGIGTRDNFTDEIQEKILELFQQTE